MALPKFAALLVVLPALMAQPPLPGLRIEPTAGGSIFFVKNTASQALTACLIELVGYPGSSDSFWQDNNASELIPAGVELRIPVSNMTVGAAPEYVKLQAAIYADGTSSGIPEKVTQLVERRRFILETTRELIRRLEKAQPAGVAKTALIADLNEWSESMQPPGKSRQVSQATINRAAARGLIAQTIGQLNDTSLGEALGKLRAAERSLAASKPAL
ncbi:MAG: hypothetical protein ACLQU1_08200 [Bryobacteraceae bacterium]